MAATSHMNQPSSTYGGFGSHGDSYNSKNYGTYDSGIGSLTSHPYQYETNNSGAHDSHQQPIHSNDQSTDLHSLKTNDRSRTMNMDQLHGTTKPTGIPTKKKIDNKQTNAKTQPQKSNARTNHPHPPPPVDQHQQKSDALPNNRLPKQTKPNRSDPQLAKSRTPPPPIHRRSVPDDPDNQASKAPRPSQDMKPTKSSMMRAAANKKRGEDQAQKRKNQFFPSKLKSQPEVAQTDIEQSDVEKSKQDPKQSHPPRKPQKSSHSDGDQADLRKVDRTKKHPHSHDSHRKNQHRDDERHSSGDEDHHEHPRSKSHKRAPNSDNNHHDRHPTLPPLRPSRFGRYHDPYLDYPVPPPGYPGRRRYPYDDHPYYALHYNRYGPRHLYEDADDIPPYLAPYHDPYDPFFDYQKRKGQPKHAKEKADHQTDHENGHDGDRDDGARSQASRKSKHRNQNNAGRKSRHDQDERRHWPPGYYPPHYYHDEDPLEIWRQERNDYLKKKFKPTIHDVLYSQQWMKSDSYLENQHRRALRNAQGYYFPYKRYTLKDYKDMQKLNNPNPYAELPEATIDRRERAKKRQEYGTQVERQVIDHPHTRHVPPREMQPRKPWHLSSGETHEPNAASKRERALEYAKIQVKYRPTDSQEPRSERSDHNESYANNFFLDGNDDGDGSNHQGKGKVHQSYDDYDY